MFCLEFTDKDIQQLIAVSYKIDYLNSAIDTNNDKSKGKNKTWIMIFN